jgi:hypothetical protein
VVVVAVCGEGAVMGGETLGMGGEKVVMCGEMVVEGGEVLGAERPKLLVDLYCFRVISIPCRQVLQQHKAAQRLRQDGQRRQEVHLDSLNGQPRKRAEETEDHKPSGVLQHLCTALQPAMH